MATPVAILFAARDSVYRTLPDCHVYDVDRDARTYRGPWPVVAHPPCRGWCRLRKLSHATAEENWLAVWAVACVRVFGGVLEHPMGSSLWPHLDLPRPGAAPDAFGGFTLQVDQHDWGHLARKRTWLYFNQVVAPVSSKVGLADGDMGTPDVRVAPTDRVAHNVATRSHNIDGVGTPTWRVGGPLEEVGKWVPPLAPRATDLPPCVMNAGVNDLPRVPRRERAATPQAFAKWLCRVARASARPGNAKTPAYLRGMRPSGASFRAPEPC